MKAAKLKNETTSSVKSRSGRPATEIIPCSPPEVIRWAAERGSDIKPNSNDAAELSKNDRALSG